MKVYTFKKTDISKIHDVGLYFVLFLKKHFLPKKNGKVSYLISNINSLFQKIDKKILFIIIT